MGVPPNADGRSTIVTLTMNPALDITTSAETVGHTDKVRCDAARYDAGGGGINAARFAHVLGTPVSAIFPVGGATGALLGDLVADAGVPSHRVQIASPTRESFTINERVTGKQYRFVLPGPQMTPAEQTQLLDQLRVAASGAKFVVASGSLPPSVAPDFYQRVADICRELDVPLVLDTSGGGLSHVTSGVHVLKPSVRELRECVGRALETEAEQLAAAHGLIDRGVTQAVVVSLGSHGALLATSGGSWRFSAIPVHTVSGVGAGDAMVAAMTVGLANAWSLPKSVRFGIAAATAKLLTPGTSVCTRSDVERFFDMVAEPSEVVRIR